MRFFSDKNKEKFKQDLQKKLWEELNKLNYTNTLCKHFIKVYSDVYDKNFPLLETEVKLKDLRTPWKSKAMRESSKQKQKFNINFLNGKIQKMNLYTKITKTLRKIKEKVRANILSKHVRKTQRQCKTTMAGLERSYRKNSEEKSIFPNFT